LEIIGNYVETLGGWEREREREGGREGEREGERKIVERENRVHNVK